ncbi:uncharacterized protein [Anabrus simplex]|uniref:uncharacterized protein n=1 Tax=Anabrus simplex TaxID=316456 RepID=UPI0035A3A5DE
MSSVGPSKREIRRFLRMAVTELCLEMLRHRKERRWWSRPWIQRREELGASSRLFQELKEEDPETYRNVLRMSPSKFQELLELVEPLIKKQDTKMREAIPCKIKLEITLRYLATGDSFRSLALLFRVSHNSISVFLPEVLAAIFEVLQPFMKVPDTTSQWNEIQKGFEYKWNFPHCCAALDGKHIRIKRPPNSTSSFFNYKGTYSIILFAMVDADFCFRYIDVGHDGRANDSTVFKNSTLKIALEKNLLNWPNGGLCVADDAFCLTPFCLKPFSHRGLTVQERVFNYRLSRARRVAENAFGILAARFRVFNTPIPLNVDTIETLVKSACAIHNWLRQTSSRTYFPSGSVDDEDLNTGVITPGAWRIVPTFMSPVDRFYSSNNCGRAGEQVRKWYMHQFMTTLSVPWQMTSIGMKPDDNSVV